MRILQGDSSRFAVWREDPLKRNGYDLTVVSVDVNRVQKFKFNPVISIVDPLTEQTAYNIDPNTGENFEISNIDYYDNLGLSATVIKKNHTDTSIYKHPLFATYNHTHIISERINSIKTLAYNGLIQLSLIHSSSLLSKLMISGYDWKFEIQAESTNESLDQNYNLTQEIIGYSFQPEFPLIDLTYEIILMQNTTSYVKPLSDSSLISDMSIESYINQTVNIPLSNLHLSDNNMIYSTIIDKNDASIDTYIKTSGTYNLTYENVTSMVMNLLDGCFFSKVLNSSRTICIDEIGKVYYLDSHTNFDNNTQESQLNVQVKYVTSVTIPLILEQEQVYRVIDAFQLSYKMSETQDSLYGTLVHCVPSNSTTGLKLFYISSNDILYNSPQLTSATYKNIDSITSCSVPNYVSDVQYL